MANLCKLNKLQKEGERQSRRGIYLTLSEFMQK